MQTRLKSDAISGLLILLTGKYKHNKIHTLIIFSKFNTILPHAAVKVVIHFYFWEKWHKGLLS